MKIYAQMDTKSDAKIDVWAIRGPTFEVLGHVFRIKRLYWFGALCVLALWVSTYATGLTCWVAARWIATIDATHCPRVAMFDDTL